MKTKEQVTCKMKWVSSCMTMSRNCSAFWEGWHWDDNEGGCLDPELCAKASRVEAECIRRHKMHTSVPREACLRETGKAPIKRGWPETYNGQPGKPNVCARWVAKEHKTHARPVCYASPPLEALKVVLSEVATVERGGKVVALVEVRRACFCAPAQRRVFVELPPEDCQAGDEHKCGLLPAQIWKEELASTLSDLKLTRRIACTCVWQGCIKGEHVAGTVHGDDIMIGV